MMFERLTRWENNDKDVADLIEEKSDFDGLTEAVNRLAEYEDIGLSPEEITDMIYRFEAFLCEMTGNRMSKSNYTLDAMISAANDYQQSLCDGCWDRSELAKYYELEHEKRLVVLPCKAGDVVWKIKAVFSYFSKPMEDRVERIIISSNEILVCCTSGTKFSVNSIGKTVFLSREEAEKALEVRE